ncbi:MAG: FHA domain-containing protein [Myxococcota bacterium]
MVRELDRDLEIGAQGDIVVYAYGKTDPPCRIVRRNGAWFLVDEFRTYLNGSQFGVPQQLRSGDQIYFSYSTRARVADRYPEASLVSHQLPEFGAPIGDELVMGSTAPGSRPDVVLQDSSRVSVTIRREPWRAVDCRSVALIASDARGFRDDDALRHGDVLRFQRNGYFHFYERRPVPKRSVFFEPPFGPIADLLISPDPGTQRQGLQLLATVAVGPRADEIIDALVPGTPLDPLFSSMMRPPPLTFDEPALLGPRRAAFQLIALHVLAAATTKAAVAHRRMIQRLWIGYVPGPPWWERRSLSEMPPSLLVDTTPLHAFPNLEELCVEDSAVQIGPPAPQVSTLYLLRCQTSQPNNWPFLSSELQHAFPGARFGHPGDWNPEETS